MAITIPDKKKTEKAAAVNRFALSFLQKDSEKNSNFTQFKVGQANIVHLFSPDLIKHVLQTNPGNYLKGKEFDVLKISIGKGLLTNEGESWLKQRRLIQPLFHKQHLAAFSMQMVASTASLIQKWETKQNAIIEDMYSEIVELNLDIILKTIFSNDMTNIEEEIKTITAALIEETAASMVSVLGSVSGIQDLQSLKKNAVYLSGIISDITESRKKKQAAHFDLLDMLMNAEYADTKQKIEPKQLLDELMTLLFTGMETTSSALTFVLYLLYGHPDVLEKFYNEIKFLNGRPPSPEDFKNLPYTNQIISESMRLYPPVWYISRSAIQDDSIEDLKINRGDAIVFSPYIMHRSSKFWEQPDVFNPERFKDRNQNNNFIYFPFGGGPRTCIGNNFAFMSLTTSLVMIAQKFKLQPVSSGQLKLSPLITLRPKEPLMMGIKKV